MKTLTTKFVYTVNIILALKFHFIELQCSNNDFSIIYNIIEFSKSKTKRKINIKLLTDHGCHSLSLSPCDIIILFFFTFLL